MDRLEERLKVLQNVRGFGSGRIGSLIRSFGGEEELISVLEDGDVSRLSSVDRVSDRMAVELVLAYRGEDPSTILRTEGSVQIYREIVEHLGSYMQTTSGRNRVSLLLPCGDLDRRAEEAQCRYGLVSLLDGVDRKEVQELLKIIDRPVRQGRTNSKLNYVVMVESEDCYDVVRDLGIDRRCLVISPDEYERSMEGDLILVHDRRELDESEIPLAASVHYRSHPVDIIPDLILDRYGGREEQLKALSRLRSIYGKDGKAKDALEKLEALSEMVGNVKGADEIGDMVEEIRAEVEGSLKKSIEGLTLSGADTLSILSSDEPPALREVYSDHSKMAAELVKERTGRKADLFNMNYPLSINEEALERMVDEIRDEESLSRFERKQVLAGELSRMWEEIESEISWALDLDFRLAMACFVKDHDLHPFKISDDWLGIYRGCHLMLRSREERQDIDYHLGPVPGYAGTMFPFRQVSDSRSAILTGANSGGKTTLLETVAQIIIMARMGLPVPAEKAYLPDINNVFLYKPKRRMDAGGLEGFLKELLPLVLQVGRGSIVLADELEAMTELEAASRMIGVFVEEIQKRDAYSIVVTHMADEICRFVECRVDGIEARGLDEKYELIVDRSPMIGRHARSTPELILRKLEGRSKGEEREVYSKVLSKFQQ